MLYIGSRRSQYKSNSSVDIQVVSKCGDAEWVENGRSMGRCAADGVCVATWNNVPVQSGENQVTVRASGLSDNCVWYNND